MAVSSDLLAELVRVCCHWWHGGCESGSAIHWRCVKLLPFSFTTEVRPMHWSYEPTEKGIN